MFKKIYFYLVLIPVVAFFLLPVLPTQAASLNFDVQPADSVASALGYFRFAAQPGHSYPLTVALHNSSDRAATVNMTRDNALTSTFGGIQYTAEKGLPYSRLTDPSRAMAPLLYGPKSVTLAAGQSLDVTYTLKLPDHLSTGVLLGGLSFSSPTSQTTSTGKSKNQSIVIHSQVDRVIGIEAIVGQAPAADVTFHQPSVAITTSTPIVLPKIQNRSATIAMGVNFSWEVYDASGKKLFDGRANDFNMAPCSSVGYSIPWGAKTFSPGDYQLDIIHEVNGKTVRDRYSFTVPDQAVENYQRETQTRSVAAPYDHLTIIIISTLVSLVIILALLLVFILWKRRKNDGEEDQKAKKGE
ncbi:MULTISPECIES: WxL protein peptidoglycan domain-containing protein [unclassified Sporolactobacillus]|uniref:WxL protein peptidoglycan domain-containing protein n=1 Tax=unclassified Sporolactobacillus TaxID=2628533 RepID=UPI002367A979|nr:DUF916 domain-containing protein [Sporolactobacillus sp. CQH2019]MDD9150453.1 DUF916 domain-containing protein [Sporolactobacillus sp. CQH2019]